MSAMLCRATSSATGNTILLKIIGAKSLYGAVLMWSNLSALMSLLVSVFGAFSQWQTVLCLNRARSPIKTLSMLLTIARNCPLFIIFIVAPRQSPKFYKQWKMSAACFFHCLQPPISYTTTFSIIIFLAPTKYSLGQPHQKLALG